MPNASVQAAAEGMPDFKKAFFDLEGLISDARQRAGVASHLADIIEDDSIMDEHPVSPSTVKALGFMASDVLRAIEALEDVWTETHNAFCTAEARAHEGAVR